MTAKFEMDAIDRKILDGLRQRADIANNALAAEVGLSPGPCLRRVQRLRSSGVIRGYSIDIDPEALGFQMSAFVEITLKQHTRQAATRFMREVRTRDLIVSCHMVAGDCDFLLLVRAHDIVEFRKLIWEDLNSIEGVGRIRSIVVLDSVK